MLAFRKQSKPSDLSYSSDHSILSITSTMSIVIDSFIDKQYNIS